MKKALLIILFASSLFLSRAQESFPVVTTNYNLKLSFDFNEETLSGVSRIQIENKSDSVIDTIPIVLYRLMNVSSIKGESGKELEYTQKVVQFDDSLANLNPIFENKVVILRSLVSAIKYEL